MKLPARRVVEEPSEELNAPLPSYEELLRQLDAAEEEDEVISVEDRQVRPKEFAEEALPCQAAWLAVAQRHDFAAAGRLLDAARVAGGAVAVGRLLAAVDADGNTPLHCCALGDTSTDRGSAGQHLIELLVSARARVDATNMLGETPLISAVRGPASGELVRALLLARSDPGCADVLTGETALMEAACSGSTALCRVLLDARADPQQRNPQGLTAWDLATAAGNDGVASLPGLHPGAFIASAEGAASEGLQGTTPGAPSNPRTGIGGAVDGDLEQLTTALGTPDVCRQEARKSSISLRQRCELYGVPMDKLGTFLAAPVLQECEQLTRMSDEELQTACRATGFWGEIDGWDEKEMVARLRQLCIWKAMPMAALQVECRALASDVVEAQTSRIGRLLEKEELVEALVVAKWGGLTQSEKLHAACKERGIPLGRLEGLEQVAELLAQVEQLESKGLADLRNEYRKCGFAPSAGASKKTLVDNLTEVLVWGAMPLSALREVCKERRLAARGDQRRADLLQLLAQASWEARGIPVQKFPDRVVANGLLDQVDRLEAKSVTELRAECRRKELPFGALGDKRDLVACLTAVIVWRHIAVEELRAELLGCSGGPGASEAAEIARLDRAELVQQLTGAMLLELWRKKGIDARISDCGVAEALFREVGRLEEQSLLVLRQEYWSCGLPPETDVSKRELVDRLTKLLVWQRVPVAELKKECAQLHIAVVGLRGKGEDEQRQELVALLFHNMCREAWEARGIPVRRLGSMQVAAAVVEQHARLDNMSAECLRTEYSTLGMPKGAGEPSTRPELLERLKSVALWRELPLKELQKECREMDVSTSGLNGKPTEAEQRAELVERLLLGLSLESWEARGIPVRRIDSIEAARRVVERAAALEAMTDRQLEEEYVALRLPAEAGEVPDRDEFLTRLKEVARWKALSLKELQRECKEADVSLGGVSSKLGEMEQHRELVERLILCTCATAWELMGLPLQRLGGIQAAAQLAKEYERLERLDALRQSELRKEYSALGLPPDAGKLPLEGELLARLKQVAVWRALPAHELRKECQERNVSTGGLSNNLNEPEPRREVVERLIMVLCAEVWDRKGVPLRKLATIQAAGTVAREWERLGLLSDVDLRSTYVALGVPESVEVPDKRPELLSRMKQVALWRALPLNELRKECQDRRLPCAADNPEELVNRLLKGAWGPAPQRGERPKETPIGGKPEAPKEKPFWGSAYPGDHRRERPRNDLLAPDPTRGLARHFGTLELPITASADEVRRTYRKLALKHHPDKNLGKAEEEAARKFREVTQAYEVLCEHFKARTS